jgi:hypothetical protein
MKNRGTYIFAFIISLVVGFTVFDYYKSQKDEKKKSDHSLFLKVKKEELKYFEIERSGQPSIKVAMKDNKWQILQPIEEEADQNSVQDFIDALALDKSVSQALDKEGSSEEVNWSIYGLDKPTAVIKLWANNTGEGLPAAVFNIGKKNFQNENYVKVNNEKKVFVGQAVWQNRADKTPIEFRDKALLPSRTAELSELESFNFELGREKFNFSKNNGTWILEQHKDWKLDSTLVQELLSIFTAAEITEFVIENNIKPEDLKMFSLNKPMVKANFSFKNSNWNAQFSIGKNKEHFVLTSEPKRVVKVSPSAVDKLYKLSAINLRDYKFPFAFEKEKIESLEVLNTTDNKMQKQDVSGDKLSALVSRIRTLKASEFSGRKRSIIGSEKGFLLTFKMKDKSQQTLFFTDKAVGKRSFVESSLSEESLFISEDAFASLKIDELFVPEAKSNEKKNEKN